MNVNAQMGGFQNGVKGQRGISQLSNQRASQQTRVQQQQQQQQRANASSQHDSLVREARLRLDFKKSFMDDEFFFPETTSISNQRQVSLSGKEFLSPANVRAVLNAGNPLIQLQHDSKDTINDHIAPNMSTRSLEQQYFQSQVAAAAQQHQQQQQQQQQQQHHANPYLSNTGYHNYPQQHSGYVVEGVHNW
ncbi:LAFE_0D10748g1_1 [Lachancea fermentati]|uniref:LAFE_0D10748g1_1 n=1 Tax=Lachancea fermentati TaxID=4955 RepID=A0A1G4MBX9_LACFM|nr:LAFE_0D10748g1_1 [Lachancea fermentati]